jgi:hypothetical protein
MPRFNTGDCVRIVPNEPTPFANLRATVREVHLHDRGVAVLDRYLVVFAWGEEQTFYDVQLEEIEKLSAARRTLDQSTAEISPAQTSRAITDRA